MMPVLTHFSELFKARVVLCIWTWQGCLKEGSALIFARALWCEKMAKINSGFFGVITPVTKP